MSEGVEASAIIATLGMKRHPEGGWYAETFRDAATHGGRAASTAIAPTRNAASMSKMAPSSSPSCA